MTSEFSIVDTASVSNFGRVWQEIVDASPDAWIWHTYRAFAFNLCAGKELGAEDRSFFISDGDRIVGLVPLILQTRGRGEGAFREAAFYSGILPWPCFRPDALRKRDLEAFAFEELERRARDGGAIRIRILLTPLKNTDTEEGRVKRIAEMFGYTRKKLEFHVVFVGKDTFGNVRERYRRYHKKFSPLFDVHIVEGAGVTSGFVDQYAQLHEKNAGKHVRSLESYEKQADFARFGEGFYVEAIHKERGEVAGILLVSQYKRVAYDNSVAVDPSYEQLRVGHILKWVAIEELLRLGIERYVLGPRADSSATEKERGISNFKDGWARGEVCTMWEIEKFLDGHLREGTL